MFTFTFAGDESGDVSFNFAKGASRYFVVTVIATQKPEELCGLLERLRKDSKLPERYEFGYPDQTKDELRRIMKVRNINHRFRRISTRRSQSEPLIQIADLIAGAIWRRDTHNDSGAFDVIEQKIRNLIEYG